MEEVVSGKTSLAYLVAQELRKKIYILNGTALQKPSDIISPLTTLKEGEILFIDEIHMISKEIYELLYPVLEDNQINLIIGKEYNSKIINLKLPKFTLIVATTALNRLVTPFVNRFPINFFFENYSNEDIKTIVHNHLVKMKIFLDDECEFFISLHCKSNPRIAINILKRLFDFILIEEPKKIDAEYLKDTLEKLNIYKYGLTSQDLNYMRLLKHNKFLGLESLKQILNLPFSVILNNIEPNLFANGLLTKNHRGRSLTIKGEELVIETAKIKF